MPRQVTEHFSLDEFTKGMPEEDVPAIVLENIELLCMDILEPARIALGVPIRVTSGYRPPEHNAEVGGVQHSDHQRGAAADLQAYHGNGKKWFENTEALAQWIREHRKGHYGQLILEDHRDAVDNPWQLWVHVSLPSAKHPGLDGDPNRDLLSKAPGEYEQLA